MSVCCALCASPVAVNYMSDGPNAFCCPGCLSVYNVLSHRGELAGYQETLLFRQAVQAGLISNPHLLERLHQNQEALAGEPRQKLYLEITDLWCPSCAEVIKLILLQERGVVHCVVDYFTDMASIEFAPRFVGKERLEAVIHSLGYHAIPLDGGVTRRVGLSLWLRFAVAAFCALNLMMFAYPIYASYFTDETGGYAQLFGWLSLAGALPVVLYSALPLYQRVISGLRVGFLGMEGLVVMGVIASFTYSLYELLAGDMHLYFDSMAVIIAFVLLGKIIETRAKFSAKESLVRLTQALPRRGRKRQPDGQEIFVPLKEIALGDILVALTGEKIVLDGVVIEGQGSVDESLMSGESLPKVKPLGALVMAGTLVRQGRLAYRVTSTLEQTLLHQIIDRVGQDLGQKAVAVRLTDQLAAWFVPLTLLLALGIAVTIYWSGGSLEAAFLRALAMLLIACPCAIGIAIPLAESHLMQALASLGVIVRNRRCLSFLGRETCFVFDKTGTITAGTFTLLNDLTVLSQQDRTLLKGLTLHSIHPIASAIANAVTDPPAVFSSVEELAGRGLRGILDERIYLLGSAAFLLSQGISIVESAKQGIVTCVYFAVDHTLLATLCLGDRIRPEASEAVSSLTMPCSLLSGDSAPVVEEVATTCGFSEWRAGCSPLDKRAYIDTLAAKGQIVAMLGDGINDTLALTAAHVGISVVSATDVSIQVSDLLLTTDRLSILPEMCALARQGQAIIRQNLFWAFAYNIVGIGLAAYGILSPIFAAFAMVASSLMVLLNAQRLKINPS